MTSPAAPPFFALDWILLPHVLVPARGAIAVAEHIQRYKEDISALLRLLAM